MRKNFKWKLIAFLAVVASLLLLGGCKGCKFQYTLEEKREETGMTACVTYYTNDKGAYFGTSDTEKKLYFPAGAVAMNIGTDIVTNGTIPTPTRENYTLVGWHEAELGPTGEIMRDEDGNVVLKAEAFDFKTKLQNGDDIVLYAKWQKNEGIHVYLLCDGITEDAPFTITVGEGEDKKDVTVENNGKLVEYPYTQNVWYKTDPPKAKGYTFFGLYEDKECTKEVSATVNQNEKGDYTIYAKYIKGNWTILRTPADIQSKLLFATYIGNTNFYLANDIDCKDITVGKLGAFSRNLQGNGYTIKNLNVDAGEIMQSEVVVSTFGRITSKGKIENVTFENITFNSKLTTKGAEVRAKAYVLMQSMDEGATINNVAIKGTLKVNIIRDKICVYTNMLVDENGEYAWDYSNLLFGGDGTDTEQANLYGVDISGITETIVEMKDINGNDNYTIDLKKQTKSED
ncbi:MAG: hypothetical protein E7368_01680 [Clostridiales bacterium]|nr:hypothetical protein [Clostridiales bacterium]